MEFTYTCARIICAIFIMLLMAVCLSPVYIMLVNGVDETTMATFITGVVFLAPLLGFILSFKYMSKQHPNKTRKKSLLYVLAILLGLLLFSFYAEKRHEEQQAEINVVIQEELMKMREEAIQRYQGMETPTEQIPQNSLEDNATSK